MRGSRTIFLQYVCLSMMFVFVFSCAICSVAIARGGAGGGSGGYTMSTTAMATQTYMNNANSNAYQAMAQTYMNNANSNAYQTMAQTYMNNANSNAYQTMAQTYMNNANNNAYQTMTQAYMNNANSNAYQTMNSGYMNSYGLQTMGGVGYNNSQGTMANLGQWSMKPDRTVSDTAFNGTNAFAFMALNQFGSPDLGISRAYAFGNYGNNGPAFGLNQAGWANQYNTGFMNQASRSYWDDLDVTHAQAMYNVGLMGTPFMNMNQNSYQNTFTYMIP
ncbi:MAG: hypothetical protein ACMUJM_19695 [bacterium]